MRRGFWLSRFCFDAVLCVAIMSVVDFACRCFCVCRFFPLAIFVRREFLVAVSTLAVFVRRDHFLVTVLCIGIISRCFCSLCLCIVVFVCRGFCLSLCLAVEVFWPVVVFVCRIWPLSVFACRGFRASRILHVAVLELLLCESRFLYFAILDQACFCTSVFCMSRVLFRCFGVAVLSVHREARGANETSAKQMRSSFIFN